MMAQTQNKTPSANHPASRCSPMKAKSKRLHRWARAHNPVNDPPFSWRRGLLLVLVVALYLNQQYLPGPLADVGRIVVADWQAGIYFRLTAFFLACWSLFGVRAMHPVMSVVQFLQIVYLCSRIAEVRISHEPLTITFATLTLLLSLVSSRIITRPNEYELAQMAQQENPDDVQI